MSRFSLTNQFSPISFKFCYISQWLVKFFNLLTKTETGGEQNEKLLLPTREDMYATLQPFHPYSRCNRADDASFREVVVMLLLQLLMYPYNNRPIGLDGIECLAAICLFILNSNQILFFFFLHFYSSILFGTLRWDGRTDRPTNERFLYFSICLFGKINKSSWNDF